MRKFFLSTAASIAAVVAVASPASAATIVLNPGPNGTLSGGFSGLVTAGSPDAPATFSQVFSFILPERGLTSASITTTLTGTGDVGESTNIDFISVLLNGAEFTLSPTGFAEFGSISNLMTSAGTQFLTVNGIARGNGSFGGNVTFAPAVAGAVPEPTTWALLLLGFAAVGFSMRRSKPSVREARVRYNFA